MIRVTVGFVLPVPEALVKPGYITWVTVLLAAAAASPFDTFTCIIEQTPPHWGVVVPELFSMFWLTKLILASRYIGIGWMNIATAEIYTKEIDRKRLGIEASRIVADQIENM